jgi:hypothetical protein
LYIKKSPEKNGKIDFGVVLSISVIDIYPRVYIKNNIGLIESDDEDEDNK